MGSIRVPLESSDRQLVERIQRYLVEQNQRVILCQRASESRIARLRNHTAHRPESTDLEALQEILEIASARVRRRLTERFNHATVHHLSRGIRNHEHRQRGLGMVQRAIPFRQRAHRRRPSLSTDQQDHHQQVENFVHAQIARLQGDQDHRQERVNNNVNDPLPRLQGNQDHRQERVDAIVNEQIARLEGLQLQDTVGHHPVLPPVLSTHMFAGIE